MRTLNASQQTRAASTHFAFVLFVEFNFLSGTVRFNNSSVNLDWNGFNWLGVGSLGSISEFKESVTGEVAGLNFQLFATQAIRAIALSEYVRGRNVNVYFAPVDDNYKLLSVPILRWSGYVDVMTPVTTASGEDYIQVQAEWRGRMFTVPKKFTFNTQDQQIKFPADKFFEFTPQVASDRQLVWPNKEYFKR